jgi:hypothetical protein
MKRTTVLIPDDLAYLLDRERRRRGVSTAAIVREAIAAHFNISDKPRRIGFASLGHSGLPNLGRDFERYLDEAWSSDEFFERTMGRPRTPTEAAAAQKHHPIWKPDLDAGDATNEARDRDDEVEVKEARVGD